jgi:hypothetical protein
MKSLNPLPRTRIDRPRDQQCLQRALTSGHFAWSHAGFAVGVDAAENGLKS